MIFTDRTIIIQKGIGSISDPIILYRGDKEVEIRFTLNEGSPFRFGSGASPNIIEKTEAAYGQLIIKAPNDLPAIFSEVAPTNNGKIVFTITAEMIDEITEVGNYTFQIRLLDESRNSRATIPEVVNGIEIREPIATEDVSTTNEADVAAVGYALTTAATPEDAFDSQGNYNKTAWGTGDRITAAKLNKIEAGIDGVNKKVTSGGTVGGEVDPSRYVTKETGNANQITFADGQTFQAKLDAGTLKGDKGDKGADGINAEIPNFTFAINMITSDQPASVSTTGTYPNLLITFNIPQNSGGSSEPIVSEPLYTFGLLSDTHIDDDGTDEAYSKSDLTNAISFLENAGADFIAYCGDMTNNGRVYDYPALKTCLESSTVPNYCVRGNHDANSLTDGYADATGCEDDYIVIQGNDLLIFISCNDTNHDTGGLTTAKLDWLEHLLQTTTDKRVFLFYHYFVDGTSGNGTGVYPWGTLKPSNTIASRFINMVKQYPNLIYCSGHSHMRFSIQDQDANANYYHNNGECYYIHTPSCAKPRYPNSSSGSGVSDYSEGSEGYLVKVYADKVVFNPIDFITSEYLTKYNYTANVSQGSNTVITYTITNDLTGVTSDNSVASAEFNSSYTATLTATEGNITDIKVTMKGKDITSSCYSNGVITIDKVTGNIVITATNKAVPEIVEITWNDGVKLDKSTGAESSSDKYSASSFIAYDNSKTYTLTLLDTSITDFTTFVCYYGSSQEFISCGSEFIGVYQNSEPVGEFTLPVVENASYIRLRLFKNSGTSNFDKSVVTLTVL